MRDPAGKVWRLEPAVGGDLKLREDALASKSPPPSTICQDKRQYVKKTGQQWTTRDKLRLTHRNSIKFKEPGLIGVGIEPHFAIGQRALFLRTPKATILWDCLPLLDEAVVEAIKAMGGISAIAISHTHYYSSKAEWSRAFGGVRIYLHAADRQWVMRPNKAIVFWGDETRALADGLTLIRCGGHFGGGTVHIGQVVLAAKERCFPATLSRWCPTGSTSASCTATRATSRYLPRPSSASSRPWSRSSTARFMGYFGTWRSRRTERQS
jgi:hypothetical protein